MTYRFVDSLADGSIGVVSDSGDFVRAINTKINLINGNALAEFIIDNNVGVATEASFEVKRIDGDYFSEQ